MKEYPVNDRINEINQRKQTAKIEWARNEIDRVNKELIAEDYMSLCCEKAYKAFQSLVEDEHNSEAPIGVTQSILDRLLKGYPLTPIEDTPDIWEPVEMPGPNGSKYYRCKRMSSLFKVIHNDGAIKYTDNNRFVWDDRYIDDLKRPDFNPSIPPKCVINFMDKEFPIKMPYYPNPEPLVVYCESIGPNVCGICSIKKPDGGEIKINRFFEKEDHEWKEITISEFFYHL